jgi:aminoglycoside phosphotransferase (APT) family kinase protein
VAGQIVNQQHFDIWRLALGAPIATEFCWLHGDLHGGNVLVEAGAISGIIDWGDITSGDPATDLAAVWSLFDDPAARTHCLNAYGASEVLRTRARGWAVIFGAVLLETGLAGNHPSHAAMGSDILRRLISDEPSGP